MASRNPYKLPRRASFVRDLLRHRSRGGGLDEDETAVINDVDAWDARTAEELAAIIFECLDARDNQTHAECIAGANESAEVWLHHLHAQVDAGHITDELRLTHVAAWRDKEVTP